MNLCSLAGANESALLCSVFWGIIVHVCECKQVFVPNTCVCEQLSEFTRVFPYMYRWGVAHLGTCMLVPLPSCNLQWMASVFGDTAQILKYIIQCSHYWWWTMGIHTGVWYIRVTERSHYSNVNEFEKCAGNHPHRRFHAKKQSHQTTISPNSCEQISRQIEPSLLASHYLLIMGFFVMRADMLMNKAGLRDYRLIGDIFSSSVSRCCQLLASSEHLNWRFLAMWMTPTLTEGCVAALEIWVSVVSYEWCEGLP